MKLLLHTCCVPCLLGTLPLISKDYDVCCFWYNPNIHPFTEYKTRLNTLEIYTGENNINLLKEDYYGLREFTHGVINNLSDKCEFCYNLRIKKCAEYAAEHKFDAFSSTLLVSLFQNHELIKEICGKSADLYNIKFEYADYRVNFREGQRQSRENNIYMQKYCGCIFSEEERYIKI